MCLLKGCYYMRQSVCLFITVLLCFVFAVSCGRKSDENTTVGGTTNSTGTTNITTTKLSKYGYGGDAEQTANEFLASLKNKDVEGFISLINWIYTDEVKKNNIQAYSFIRDIDLDSYKILKRETKKGPFDPYEQFIIEIHISKSDINLFPVGTSRWMLIIDSPLYVFNVRLFKNIDNAMNIITQKNQNDIVKFCCDFSFEMNCYESVTDFNTIVPDSNDEKAGYFCQNLIRCLPVTYDDNGSVKRDELEKLAENILGITSIDITKDIYYDKNSDSVPLLLNSASWYTCSLAASEFDSKTKQHTIIIDYYSDTAYLLKAKTMQYTIRENSDKSFMLISTVLLFDSGFQVASGLI